MWAWAAAALVVVVLAVVLWRTSSVVATSSTSATAATAPAGSPGAQLGRAWTAHTTAAASGDLVQGGRVLTTDPHGLTLRNAATGREAWHYRRSDALLCGATGVDDLVVAVFRGNDGGGCTEAVALRVGTGVRAWTRNVSYLAGARLSSTNQVVLASTPSGVVALDATGDGTRWRQSPAEGCRYVDSSVGGSGVALVQRCADQQVQVQLLDGFTGKVAWTVDLPTGGAGIRLVGADRLVDVLVGDTVHVLSATAGAQLQELRLPPPADGRATADEPLQQTAVGDVVLLWARGTGYALDSLSGATRWQAAAVGLPAVDAGAPDRVSVLEQGSYVVRSLTDGAEVSRSSVPDDLPTGGRTAQVGPLVVYATTDRVLALR